ncbi:MAG: prephenate dehydrogenase/arogenate dehydrogenase family protein [Methanomassiliicoccales archaeon]|nr:MAG: prephenate dehydrogenase/arogenate dehydrogenase family protein [Methanomassiliicoccales archaeon]
MTEKVDGIRWMIEEIDREIMVLIKKRMDAALKMGKTKVEKSMPVRNLKVEDEVIGRYISRAGEAGISEEAAKEIAQILIRESIEAQARLPRPMRSVKEVLVIGGAGKMGLWFARYMAMRGHKVKIFDKKRCKEFPNVTDMTTSVKAADVIIVAVPISEAKGVLEKIIEARPKGLVFDIMSVKQPIIRTLERAAEEGLKVCSVHPMFGPDALSMYSRNIIVCDCGSTRGVEEFLPLVEGMGANITEMPVTEHDMLISYVLGLSHAINIAFFSSLRASGIEFKSFEDIASTTFKRQASSARRVALESPDLYYEIQHENPYTERCFDLLMKVITDLKDSALSEDKERFVQMMKEGRKYFGDD